MPQEILQGLIDSGPLGLVCALLAFLLLALSGGVAWALRQWIADNKRRHAEAKATNDELVAMLKEEMSRNEVRRQAELTIRRDERDATIEAMKAQTETMQKIWETVLVMDGNLDNHRREVRTPLEKIPDQLSTLVDRMTTTANVLTAAFAAPK